MTNFNVTAFNQSLSPQVALKEALNAHRRIENCCIQTRLEKKLFLKQMSPWKGWTDIQIYTADSYVTAGKPPGMDYEVKSK